MAKGMLLTVICLIVSYTTNGQTFSQNEYNLRQRLTGPASSYSNVVRPASQVDVQIRFNLLSINGLDTRGQSLSVAGWLTVKWSDSRLVWTPSSEGNIDSLFDTELVLWRPELIIDNAVDSVGVIEDDDLLIRVKATGEVTWEPPGLYTTSCDIDVTYYPFDRQICTIEVTSWAYTINEVNLTHLSNSIFTGDYSTNGEWDLLTTKVATRSLVESEGTFTQLDFTMVLQRRVTYYVLNVILPIFLTSFLSVFTFILPFESGEKVSYALTVLLSYAVLMLLVSDTIPPTSIHVSVLGLYLALILFVGASATVLAVINLHLFHMEASTPVSKRGRSFIMSFLVPMTGWRKLNDTGNTGSSSNVKIVPMEPNDSKQSIKNKDNAESPVSDEQFYSWKEIAYMSDILCLRIYAILVLLLNVVFLIAMIAGGFSS